jgi:hypothetical protein
MIKRLCVLSAGLALLSTLAACSDDTKTNNGKEAGVGKEAGGSGDGPSSLKCSTGGSDCKDFVFDQIIMPTSSTLSSYSWDFDGDGKKDNALGQILSTLGSAFGSLNLQATIDESVFDGQTMLLLRVGAKDFTNATTATAQAWIGETTVCCAGAADGGFTDAGTVDPTKCKAQATSSSGCFGGSYTLKPKSTITAKYYLGGSITAGKIAFGPASMKLQFPIGTGATAKQLDLTLKGVRISGTLASGKISSGVLVGGISQSDLDGSVLPTVASMMTEFYKSTTDTTTKQTLKAFDTDGNGTITAAELKSNALIGTLLTPDVDVDNDGNKELSLGVGFTAVGAVIQDT